MLIALNLHFVKQSSSVIGYKTLLGQFSERLNVDIDQSEAV